MSIMYEARLLWILKFERHFVLSRTGRLMILSTLLLYNLRGFGQACPQAMTEPKSSCLYNQ